MKKIILIITLIITVNIATKAQQETQPVIAARFTNVQPQAIPVVNMFSKNSYSFFSNAPAKDHDFYTHRSKSFRTAGFILLGAGVVVSGIGLLISTNNSATLDQTETGVIIMGVGALSGIVSIPMMIMATVSKHKAKAMISSQPTGFGVPPNVSKSITGITITIPIGK